MSFLIRLTICVARGFINKPTSLEFRKFESVVTQFVYKHVSAKGHLEDLKKTTSLVIKKIDNEQK